MFPNHDHPHRALLCRPGYNIVWNQKRKACVVCGVLLVSSGVVDKEIWRDEGEEGQTLDTSLDCEGTKEQQRPQRDIPLERRVMSKLIGDFLL